MKDIVRQYERMLLQSTLWECQGNVEKAARKLEVNRTDLYRKLQRNGVFLPEAMKRTQGGDLVRLARGGGAGIEMIAAESN